jgi:Ca-activated chloride channel family protein
VQRFKSLRPRLDENAGTRNPRNGSGRVEKGRLAAGVAAGLSALLAPVAAMACPLALVLAIDVSSSVDASDYRLQMRGLGEAFEDREVVDAIVSNGGVLVTAFEWSGRNQQVPIADWTWLETPAAVQTFADRLAGASRSHYRFPTALGYALGHAAIQFNRAPRACARQVVDISGDGVNNEGFPPASAYRAFDFSRTTVNGLVIRGADPDPVTYYRETVIRGPGAFVETAETFSDYGAAMKRKLLREIAGNAFARHRAQDVPRPLAYRQFRREDAP